MRKPLLFAAVAVLIFAVLLVGYALLSSTAPAAKAPTPTAEAKASAPTVSASSAEPSPTAAASGTERIVVLHTNDLHGAVEPKRNGGDESGGLVNLVSLIDEIRAEDPEHTLVLDAGDTLQGTYVSNSTQGEVIVAAMNAAGYTAWSLGNHEFDWGQAVLRDRIAQARFPALAANILDSTSGKVWDAVEPYTIVRVGQAQVAILGLAYANTPGITRPESVAGLDFRGGVETASRYLGELAADSDLVIVLSHLSYDGDLDLAQSVATPGEIDVIVGGHAHLLLEQPEKENGALIVQAGTKGQSLGRLELTIDLATNQVTDYAYSLIPVSGEVATVNQEAKAIVSAALAEAAETMKQPIGQVARTLEPARSGEFALGNLIVDAMLGADLADGSRAEVAMHNNGGIRASLRKGPVTFGQLYEVLPFDNQLVALDLTGAQILRILEQSVADRPGQMQVAGLTFRFSSSRPAGQRVLEATVGGRPLDRQQVYRVVTIDYLASGGDGQTEFLEGANPGYGDQVVWVVAEYIRAHSPVDPKVEGRIKGF